MILSCFIYLTTFALSLSLLYLYERESYTKKNGCIKVLFICLSIFIPSILGALRKDIGYDFSAYERIYTLLKNCTFSEYIKVYFKSYEPAYYFLNRVAYYIYDSVHMVNFLSTFVIIIFIFASAKSYKKYISIWFSVFIFFMAYYNSGLNIVRQVIAMSICLYSYQFIVKHKPIKYFLYILLACMFHRTAIISFTFYFFSSSMSKKVNFLKSSILYLVCFATPLVAPLFLKIASHITFFEKYFLRYSISFNNGGIGFLVWIIPVLMPIYLLRNNIMKNNLNHKPLFDIYISFIPLRYLAYYAWWLSRLSFYASVVEIILVPLLVNSIENKRNKKIVMTYYVFWYIFYYTVMYIFNVRQDFTYPFIAVWN